LPEGAFQVWTFPCILRLLTAHPSTAENPLKFVSETFLMNRNIPAIPSLSNYWKTSGVSETSEV
jgi:hypothetical protein